MLAYNLFIYLFCAQFIYLFMFFIYLLFIYLFCVVINYLLRAYGDTVNSASIIRALTLLG